MDPDKLESLIKSHWPNADIMVRGDGRHFEAVIISPIFEGMSLLQRQREVYKIVGKYIQEGSLHALSIKAKTPSESQQEINKNG